MKKIFTLFLFAGIGAGVFSGIPAFAQTPVLPPLPTLPQAQVNVTMPDTTGYIVTTLTDTGNAVTNGNNLKSAINSASCNPQGAVIELPAGAVFETGGSSFLLPAKNCASGKWIIIRSLNHAQLPEGVRVTPANSSNMPKLLTTTIATPVFNALINAKNYRLIGLWITTITDNSAIVQFGDGGGGGPQDTIAEIPQNLIIDRSLVRGSDNPPLQSQRGVELNCGNCAVIESYIDQIHNQFADSQAIGEWNGNGPFLIRNNFLSAGSENIMFGGADTNVPNMNPQDITIIRNHIFKPYTWKPGHPTYAGIQWFTKNLLELKHGIRVLIEGNILENCFAGPQVCAAFNLKSSNPSGVNTPWAQTSDVTMRYNKIVRAEGGMFTNGHSEFNAVPMARVHAHDNIFEDQGAGTFGGANGGAYFLTSGPIDSHKYDHNTVIIAPPNPGQGWQFYSSAVPLPPIAIHDNIFAANGGAKQGCGPVENEMHCFDNPAGTPNGEDSWHKNLVYNAQVGVTGSCNPTRPFSTASPWAQNRVSCVSSISGVGFIDLASKNYRLNTSSPGKSAATDGRDVGADINMVETMTAGAISGVWGGAPPPPPSDTTPPTVSVTSPLSGATVSGSITVSANASDNNAVAGVQFLLNGSNLGVEDISAPHSISWDTAGSANGSYTISARARDFAGNQTTSAGIGITVNNIVIPTPVDGTLLLETTLENAGAVTSPATGSGAGASITGATFVSGQIGNGAQFANNTPQYIRYQQIDGVNQNIELTKGTVEFWYKPNYSHTDGIRHNIFSSGSWGQPGMFALVKDNTGNGNALRMYVFNASGAFLQSGVPSSSYSWSAGQWIKIRATWDFTMSGQTIRFYLDDVEKTPNALNGPIAMVTENSSQHIYIGSRSTTETSPAHGVIDEFKIWAGAIVPSAPPPPPQSGDSTPPSVSIPFPTSGATIFGTISVSANASDNVGVAGVQFKLNGSNLGTEDTSAPYSVSWNTAAASNGNHTLTAVARDAAGNQTTSGGVTVNVNNIAPDTTAPTISNVAATNVQTAAATIVWSTNEAADSQVEYGTTQSLGSATQIDSTPLTSHVMTLQNLNPGTAYSYKVKSKDAAGNLATSAIFNFTTQALQPPTLSVALSAVPTSGTVPLQVSLTADVSGSAIGAINYTFYCNRSDSGTNIVLGYNHKFDSTNEDPKVVNNACTYSIAGTYTAKVIAERGSAAPAESRVTVTVTTATDTIAPTVSITSPTVGQSLSSVVTVNANASDNVGVLGVQFLLNGGTLGAEDISAPYSISWNTAQSANGTHVVSARARDATGNQTTSQGVNVTVNNVVADTIVPSVNIFAPSAGASVSGTTNVSANASDNIAVIGVQFKLNGTDFGAEDIVAPYSIAWDTTNNTNGNHTLTAVARDAAGNQTTSAPVSVNVNNDVTPPAITVASPSSGQTVSGSVTLTANASDNVGVSGVQFKVGGLNVGVEDASAPYTILWNTTILSGGNHTITAVARDAAGNQSISAGVTVNVNNIPPPPPPPPLTGDSVAPIVSNIAAANITPKSVEITWTTNEAADSQIKYGTAVLNLTQTLSNFVTTHSLKLSGLSRNTTYSYQVLSKDTAGNQSQSTPLTFKTTSKPPKMRSASARQGSVILSWQNPGYAFHEKTVIARSTNSFPQEPLNASDVLATINNAIDTQFTDGAVSGGTTYYYSIFALDTDGVYSDPTFVSFTPSTPSPGAPPSGGGVTIPTPPTAPPVVETPQSFVENILDRDLQRGSRHEEVLILQQAMQILGHFPQNEVPTNYFGPLTMRAVSSFQTSQGLFASGRFDATTRALINGLTPTTLKSLATQSGTAAKALNRTSSIASRHEEVRILQSILKNLGFFPDSEQTTHYFGPITQRSLRRFQEANSISPADGVLRTNSQDLLNRLVALNPDLAKLPDTVSVPQTSPILTNPGAQQDLNATATEFTRHLREGVSHAQVKLLQEALRDNGVYPEGLVTGYFGPLTRRAVERFQEKYGIVSFGNPDTTGYGGVGPLTRGTLNEILQGKAVQGAYIEDPAALELKLHELDREIEKLDELMRLLNL